MLRNYVQVMEKAKKKGPLTISVAVAQDREVLEAVKLAGDSGLAKSLLIGNRKLIEPLLDELKLSLDVALIDEVDNNIAVIKAATLVSKGEAQILMKGLVNSSDFLKAVLNAEVGLRTGRLLSHLAAFEIFEQKKLMFFSDGGMNISPDLEQKKDILINALLALQAMGISKPKVAVLTANEKVNHKMPATIDAQELVEMSRRCELPSCIIEGPIAFDVAVNQEAARIKGIDSKISCDVDLFLMPNIETGNAVGKALIHYAGAKMSGIILGAKNPIVMTSRAETAEGKLNSIALATLAYPVEMKINNN